MPVMILVLAARRMRDPRTQLKDGGCVCPFREVAHIRPTSKDSRWFLRAFLGCPVSLRCAGRAGRFFLWHGGAGQNPRRTRCGFPAPWKLRPASKPDGGFATSLS